MGQLYKLVEHLSRRVLVIQWEGMISHEATNVRMPKALGGNGEEGTNPEQLFAAGYAACYDSALNLGTDVTAHVSISKAFDGGFELAAQLHVNLDGVERDQAEELVRAADGVCPYSRVTRGYVIIAL
ncbi:Ohr family peroxiredoxin [Paenibacillus sp. HWE-109]|uniref:Ohr family peroxiredoxin n=1 Tax=Paenibacillus sp. HWE-109 TaxID=1306526 RepID=UPI001EDCC083|nr:Ohr family peroxiredoxin [Paenibacillus sp. HWE-109]UKS31097.1 Ohr family peroxiredoxin [Paenibacillus sp. HWE-109]